MKEQKHFLFCGPSGSGKTSIVKYLLSKFSFMEFSVSCTTRPKRSTETDGIDYYFLTPGNFRKKIEAKEFLEWEEVYTDRYYGTLKSEVERIEKKQNSVIFDVDVEGGLRIKEYFSKNLLAVMVMPPSVEELRKRLTARNTETEETLKIRVAKAEHEMNYRHLFDHVIVNEHFETAIKEAELLVNNFIQPK